MINLENRHSTDKFDSYQLNNAKLLPISSVYNQANLPPPPSYQEISAESNNQTHLNDYNSSLNATVAKPINRFRPRNSQREEKYRKIIRRHEISTDFSQKLQYLQGFKIVFIFDDSGSMNTVLQDSPLNNNSSLFKVSRWDELQYFAKISIELASIFDPDGSNVYFLNRPSPIRNVKHSNDIMNVFSEKPQGFTPLARVLEQVLTENTPTVLSEKKLLIIIATDGEPTDDNGRVAIKQFKEALLRRSANTFTTIVVCTDDEDSVSYLNKWDKKIRKLDVIDDYLGSIDPTLDKLDEQTDCCCLS